MHPHYLYYCILGVAGGVLIRLVFEKSWMISSSFFLGISVGALIALITTQYLLRNGFPLRSQSRIVLTSGLLFLVCFGGGVVRADNTLAKFEDSQLDTYLGEDILIKGVVVDDPDPRERVQLIMVDPTELYRDGQWQEIEGAHILVRADLFLDYQYGDTLTAQGVLEQPKKFVTDTGREFDYVRYLQKDGVRYAMSFVQTEKISDGHISIRRSLYQLKDSMIRMGDRFLVQPEGGLLAGILLGEKRSLGNDLENAFRRTGVIHIVVLSGYNVTLVADFMIRILGVFLSRRKAVIFGIGGIVFFAILTGGGATIVRASIMAILVVIARAIGRPYQITRALLFAGALMILHNPLIFLYDLSFQLSFLATLGLIHIVPRIEEYFAWVPELLQIRESLLATLSTQIIVLPLLLYAIGEVSLIAPVTNILVLMAVPYAMLVGFLMIVVGSLLPLAGTLLAVPSYILLSYITKIVEFFSSIPFASITIPQIPLWSLTAVYVVIFVILLRRQNVS